MKLGVLFATWRTGNQECYGAVAVGREDGWKAYLGRGNGFDEAADSQKIAREGAPLMENEARAFFPQLKDEPYAY